MTETAFTYQNGTLCAEALPLSEIAEETGTPFFCSSLEQLRRNMHIFTAPFRGLRVSVRHAARANGTLAVMRALAQDGAGAEVLSAEEMARVIEADVPPCGISLSGMGKNRDDIMSALIAGIDAIEAGSFLDLELIEETASLLNRRAPVSLCVDPAGFCASAARGASFSAAQTAEALARMLSSSFLEFKGFSLASGGHDLALDRHHKAIGRLLDLVRLAHAEGLDATRIGLGDAPAFFMDETGCERASLYVRILDELLGDENLSFVFGAGSALVDSARLFVTRVLQKAEAGARSLYVLDGIPEGGKGFDALPVRVHSNKALRPSVLLDVAQEEAGADRAPCLLPEMEEGELIAFVTTGARDARDTRRALAPEIMVSGAHFAVVRRRVSAVESLAWETCPEWERDEHAA